MLKKGKHVLVKVKNVLWDKRDAYAFPIPEFNYYEGEIVYQKWFGTSQIGLTTDEPDFPFRVIEKSNIVEVDDHPVDFTREVPPVKIQVQGKTGVYTITAGTEVTRCTCPGFTYRGKCRHVDDFEMSIV